MKARVHSQNMNRQTEIMRAGNTHESTQSGYLKWISSLSGNVGLGLGAAGFDETAFDAQPVVRQVLSAAVSAKRSNYRCFVFNKAKENPPNFLVPNSLLASLIKLLQQLLTLGFGVNSNPAGRRGEAR